MISFLGEMTNKDNLAELTAFSLPEGRNPDHVDIWVFLAFAAQNGRLFPKDIKFFDRETGNGLINIGPSQTVSMRREDIKIEDSMGKHT